MMQKMYRISTIESSYVPAISIELTLETDR
jgi:hypothetical protein